MSDNGTIEALAELIKAAGLSHEQVQELNRRTKRAIVRERAQRRPRSGPYFHAKPGHVVQVKFQDGTILEMTVWKAGSNALRLTTRNYDDMKKSAALHRESIIKQFNIKPKAGHSFPSLPRQLEQSGQVERLA